MYDIEIKSDMMILIKFDMSKHVSFALDQVSIFTLQLLLVILLFFEGNTKFHPSGASNPAEN